MLGIAYSASIGGAATLIGSPPNAVFAGVAESRLDVQISFLDWLVFAGPLSVVFLFVTWLLLLKLLRPEIPVYRGVETVIRTQRAELGPISRGEQRMLAVFTLVAAGWLLRPFVLQPLFPAVTDTVVAIVGGCSSLSFLSTSKTTSSCSTGVMRRACRGAFSFSSAPDFHWRTGFRRAGSTQLSHRS